MLTDAARATEERLKAGDVEAANLALAALRDVARAVAVGRDIEDPLTRERAK
jgi:hypothetical protein